MKLDSKLSNPCAISFSYKGIAFLSGGETFIVSLGLALGLSALSSRNILDLNPLNRSVSVFIQVVILTGEYREFSCY